MESPQLNTTLNDLIGHLELRTSEEQKKFGRLSKSLSETSFTETSLTSLKGKHSYEKSDLFFENRISKTHRKTIDSVLKARTKAEKETRFRVFRREVPIREKLVHASVADWAVGAKVDHSIGPFTGKDGRRFWYDFFPLEKLMALYIQGIADPVLLFTVKTGRQLDVDIDVPIIGRAAKTYNLVKGSIWIHAKFLAPNAPDGTYAGLTINGGKITLSAQPQLVNSKLTVSANTTISVALNLDQPKVVDSDADSPYGTDARNMQLQLPESLVFHFSAHGRSIDEVGSASWEVYGQGIKFVWSQNVQTDYNPLIQRIFFPFNSSVQEIVIGKSASDFNVLSGRAAIHSCGWVLSVATIDVLQPVAAAGIGELFVQCKNGLVDEWQGLKGGGYNLNAPGLLVGPGQILWADLEAGNPHASQSLELWQDELNKFGTQVDLAFPDKTAFFYASNANGNELLMTFANADFQIDRPVKVNGEPTAIRSLNSLLVIAVGKTDKLMYLFDDNLILDEAAINNEDPIIPKRMALAMTNALFKVTQPNGCLLFGSLSDDFEKIEKGSLFLVFGLFAYLPTLPDPYAANLCFLRGQLRGRDTDVIGGPSVSGEQVNAWLVCLIAWDVPPDEAGNDNVDVSFHFAPLSDQFPGIFLDDFGRQRVCEVPPSRPIGPAHTDTSVNAVSSRDVFSENVGSASPLNTINVSSFFNTTSQSSTNTASTGGRAIGEAPGSLAAAIVADDPPLPDYGAQWDKDTYGYGRDFFALLDVSTNADLFGISFDWLTRRDYRISSNVDPATGEATADFFPIQVNGMDVVSAAANVKAFTVPQISWEPVFNLAPPETTSDPGDPSFGFNYYPNDGGPMRILNNSNKKVALAPLPLTNFILKSFDEDENFGATSLFTLPFGIKAIAQLQNKYSFFDSEKNQTLTREGSRVSRNSRDFEVSGPLKGGLQLQFDGGEAFIPEESEGFVGSTVQINNVLELDGSSNGDSTLGKDVTRIFNQDFFATGNDFPSQRGVPVTRIDLSGYGTSTFSNWLAPKAAIAETSQARFDVFVGRCAHEIVQVKSIMYPWAIKVVRTITIFRVGSGYVYRFDSGWQPESDGEFLLKYYINVNDGGIKKYEMPTKPGDPGAAFDPGLGKYEIHPGIVEGLYHIKDIKKADDINPFIGSMVSNKVVSKDGLLVNNPDPGNEVDFLLEPVYFTADVAIENAISGFKEQTVKGKKRKLVPSKNVVGYVQISPKGIPLSTVALRNLVVQQLNSIGGPIDCEIDLAGSTQKMRLNRFDFNNSFGINGTDLIFSMAGKGSVLLPKDGSWSMVMHERGTGEVSPVPTNLAIPVIREGKLVKDGITVKVDPPLANELTRIADPTELLRPPVDATLNYGFLQSTDTQKALFLAPGFKSGEKTLLSKIPPLFADAFRIVNSKGIFPNIGDGETISAENTVGEVIALGEINGSNPFAPHILKDGTQALNLMEIQDTIDGAKQQGFRLLKNTADDAFDLPTSFDLIDLGDDFRLYIDYKPSGQNGALNFDINSVQKAWKSEMSNISLVLDLAGIKKLMTVKGTWDAGNGKEANYPSPTLEFADELKPVIEILQILQKLQGGDYADAVASGLKLAMSNKAGSWEYKFEASKEIPVLRFPFPDAVYNDPNTPFKLECGLKIGAYFNAALKVTNDANELLPSAGGLFGFYGRLSVMCVSISAATIYAIGQVNLDIAADTKIGPSLRMKFGFGAQIVVGLPVAGNISVLFVVGIEIFIAQNIVEVSGFLLFEGHAEILGGIVSITIRIEAKGTYSRQNDRTDMACQVTFGLDISIAFIINISFSKSWQEQRQIA